MEILPEQVQAAVTVAAAASVLASGVWQGMRIFISQFGADTPRWLNKAAPTIISAFLAVYGLIPKGFDWPTMALGIVIALFGPKALYSTLDAADRHAKSLKGDGSNG